MSYFHFADKNKQKNQQNPKAQESQIICPLIREQEEKLRFKLRQLDSRTFPVL